MTQPEWPGAFIVGADRSGTTLLRLMLDTQDQIGCPPESRFLIALLRTLGDRPITAARWRRASHHIESSSRRDDWSIESSRLAELVSDDEVVELGVAIDRLYTAELLAETRPAPCWLDKTPEYLFHVPELAAALPRSKFIVVVRDGRDVAESLRRVGWRGRTAHAIGRYWARSATAASDAIAELGPGRSLLIRHEDLVEQPETELARIEAFLDVEFDIAKALAFHETSTGRLAGWEVSSSIHAAVQRPLGAPAKRPQASRFSKVERRILAAHISPGLARFDYSIDSRSPQEVMAWRCLGAADHVRASGLRAVTMAFADRERLTRSIRRRLPSRSLPSTLR